MIWKFFSNPIICLDGDESGQKAALRIAERLFPFIKEGNKIYFASGSGYLLNRRVIKLVLENSNLWEHQYWDDVSLALLLKKFNISPTQGKRFDISGNPYKQHIDKSNYHFR